MTDEDAAKPFATGQEFAAWFRSLEPRGPEWGTRFAATALRRAVDAGAAAGCRLYPRAREAVDVVLSAAASGQPDRVALERVWKATDDPGVDFSHACQASFAAHYLAAHLLGMPGRPESASAGWAAGWVAPHWARSVLYSMGAAPRQGLEVADVVALAESTQ